MTLFPATEGGVGAPLTRPDGPAKAAGRFVFASDLSAPGLIYGATLRSPHPRAWLRSLDVTAAAAAPGVAAVVTAADLPTQERFGLAGRDQPVLVPVGGEVLYAGEPVALVAAESPRAARAALALVEADYEVGEPLLDPIQATRQGHLHRELLIRRGEPDLRPPVLVEGYYEVGQQDQAPLGPEAGLAIPLPDGGVELVVASQDIHSDHDQLADCLGLPRARVRIRLGGVGGAFGAREDLSVHVHASLLALRTGRPVKMWYGREESFLGHVHRHPALMWYQHGAERDGTLLLVRATIILDGGAYLSTSPAVVSTAASFAAGPYRVPNAQVWCAAPRTNQAPNGAMRGFGAVQACFAHEAQMDRLAEALGLHPLRLRALNALRTGDRLLTGQVLTGSVPMAELVAAVENHPPAVQAGPAGPVRRGVGYAAGFKNIAFAEGFDDHASARVRVERRAEGVVATVQTAAAEVGQGWTTICQQIARTELGVADVRVEAFDSEGPSAGSTSASRQTWMSGGAVQGAARSAAQVLIRRAGPAAHRLAGGYAVDWEGAALVPIDALLDEPVEADAEYHHRPTDAHGADGQGDVHVSVMFALHRATVDVDVETGMMKAVEIVAAHDVGTAINPLQVLGQIEGGIAQGVGLATMEEIITRDGVALNPNFTDYLLPTSADMPAVTAILVEEPEPEAPYGAKGVGEPPMVVSPAAVAAAVRGATGKPLARIPIRPEDVVGLRSVEPPAEVAAGNPPAPVHPIERRRGQHP